MIQKRPPIVAILGSIDHGKTTLLDYIRKANVAVKEAGGITQSVGAYEVEHNGKKITFIDTPGHGAFIKLKSRGVEAADIAVLVVAADDGVQPQSIEAFKIIEEAKIPLIVAINKIDIPGIKIDKVKNELLSTGIYLEGMGGNVSCQLISAKTGEGVNELLDLILLAVELEDLTFDSEAGISTGYILEAKLDSKKGALATVIVKDGKLRVGDNFRSGDVEGKIKGLSDFLGHKITEAVPSMPVQIFGLGSLPDVGEDFEAGKWEIIVKKTKKAAPIKKEIANERKEKALKLILKADTTGSLEALAQIINSLPREKDIEMISQEVGMITDGDIKLAKDINAQIIGFKVDLTRPAKEFLTHNPVNIITSEIIYDLIQKIEESLKEKIIKILGKLQILACFKSKGKEQVIGGKIIEGYLKNSIVVEIERKGKAIDTCKILNLQKDKQDAALLNIGETGGLLAESKTKIEPDDILVWKQA